MVSTKEVFFLTVAKKPTKNPTWFIFNLCVVFSISESPLKSECPNRHTGIFFQNRIIKIKHSLGFFFNLSLFLSEILFECKCQKFYEHTGTNPGLGNELNSVGHSKVELNMQH